MSKPILVLVPGYWEGVAAFEPLKNALQGLGYEIHIAPRPSTDLPAAENPEPSQEHDKTAIREVLLKLLETGKEIILLPHSAGGFLAGEAMKGLDIKSRAQEGLKGGVKSFVFLSAATWPAGTVHGEIPFAHLDENGGMHCNDPEQILFNDFSPELLKEWLPKMNPQPKGSWTGTTNHVGWTDLPSAYIVFEQDACIMPDLALKLAGWANSRVVRGCEGGHMAQISQTQELARMIDETVSEM